jgi:hypothetical protein
VPDTPNRGTGGAGVLAVAWVVGGSMRTGAGSEQPMVTTKVTHSKATSRRTMRSG